MSEDARSRRRPGSRRKLQVVSEEAPPQPLTGFSEMIQIGVERKLDAFLENMITSAINGGDYRYGSTSDLIREALDDLRNGVPVTEPASTDPKKIRTIRVTAVAKAFWQTLPRGHRRALLDRAIRTKLKQLEAE